MAIGIFAKNLAESRKTTAAGRYLRDFKPALNTRYRVFLPQFQYMDDNGNQAEQIATITVGARQFSYKALGVFSYVFDSNEITIADDDSFTDNTELARLERTANILHRAAHAAALAAAENAVREEAKEAGTEVNQEALAQQRDIIDKKYFGDKDKDPEVKPVVGQAQKYTYTIGLFIPMTSQGVPEWEKAQVGIWQLSGNRQGKIADLYKAESYSYTGKPYFEFSFDYKGETPKEAGKNASYEYIPENLSLATKHPADWQNEGAKLVAQLPTGTPDDMANTIVAKCSVLHNRNTIADIISKFNAHVSTLQTAVIAIKKLDPEYLKKNKRFIQQIPTLSKYPAIKDYIDNLEEVKDDETTEAAPVKEEAHEEASATTEKQVKPEVNIQGAEGAVTFGGLNPNAVGTASDDDSLFGDV